MFIVSPPTRADLHGVDHDVDCGVGHDEDVADVGDDVLHQAHHGLPRHNRQPRDQLLDITQMLEILNFDIDTIGMDVIKAQSHIQLSINENAFIVCCGLLLKFYSEEKQ